MKRQYLYLVPLFLFIVLFSLGKSVLAVDRDLFIDSVTFEPAQPIVGQVTRIIVKARYFGTSSLTINEGINNVAFAHNDFWPINSSDNGPSVSLSSYSPLYSGGYYSYVFTGRFMSDGTKMLVFKVDGANQLAEVNENNNLKNVTVNVFKSGDLIKLANNSAVYLIKDDGQKHLFVNSPTFWSYYSGGWNSLKLNDQFVYIKELSQATFDSIPVGKNVTIKPGAKLVKFQNSPRVYIVFGSAKLKQVSDQIALNLYGYNWGSRVTTIQNGFESDYFRSDQDFVDSDGDGLADEDERSVYLSNPYSVDTDLDGYRDGFEVINNYNPII